VDRTPSSHILTGGGWYFGQGIESGTGPPPRLKPCFQNVWTRRLKCRSSHLRDRLGGAAECDCPHMSWLDTTAGTPLRERGALLHESPEFLQPPVGWVPLKDVNLRQGLQSTVPLFEVRKPDTLRVDSAT